jgi:hypothetical protein
MMKEMGISVNISMDISKRIMKFTNLPQQTSFPGQAIVLILHLLFLKTWSEKRMNPNVMEK